MSQTSVIAAAFILLVGLYFGFRDWRRTSSELANLQAEKNIRSAPLTPPTPTLPTTLPTQAFSKQRQQDKQTEIQNLQIQLSQEQQILQEQSQAINDLKSRKSQQDRLNSTIYDSQVLNRNAEIQNLTESLQNQRLIEDDIAEATDILLKDQSSAAQLSYTQVDQRIETVERDIQQTQEQIQFWSTNFSNVTLQQARLEELRLILANLRQELNDLQLQRLGISQQVLTQNRNIHAQAQSQKADLIENENLIAAQIADLRQELRQLQETRNRRLMSSQSLEEQIRQTQSSLEQQAQKIEALESSLQERQNELRGMQ